MHEGASFEPIITLLSNVLDAHTTALFLFDPRTSELRLTASQSTSKYLKDRIVLPLDQSGLIAQVHKMGHPIHLGKMALDDIQGPLPFYRDGESGIKGLFVVPIGKTEGLLYADTKRSWGFNDKQQKWMVEIAGVLHNLLEKERCLVQGEDYSRILNLWHHLGETVASEQDMTGLSRSLVALCTEYLGTEYGFIAVRHAGDDHYTLVGATPSLPASYLKQCFLVKNGLVGWLFLNRKSLFIQKLNADSAEHHILTPAEKIPHSGTFWGIYGNIATALDLVFVTISKDERRWHVDDRHAITKSYQFFLGAYEKLYWKEKWEYSRYNDLNTGLFNALGFEKQLSELLISSLQRSDPFTMVIVQFEPWQLCYCRVPLPETQQWQRAIGEELRTKLPSDTIIGRMGENRFGLLFPGRSERDAARCCNSVRIFNVPLEAAKRRGIRLRAYLGWAVFPQSGTRLEQLWQTAYQSLWEDFRRAKRATV